jgi:membrane associated rhomboid family serine protease
MPQADPIQHEAMPSTDPAPSVAADAQVNAAGSHGKGVLRWGYFLLLNAIAGVIALSFFIGIFYADGLDPYLHGTYTWLLAHPGVTSMAAFSPLACSLLVGYGYGQRARKRRLAQQAADEAKAAKAAARGGDPIDEAKAAA